jgi:DNA-binding NtrC family response regulator
MEGLVLLVDDEPEVARSLQKALERRDADFTIRLAHTKHEALADFKKHKPEVVILDLTIAPSEGPESGLSLLDSLIKSDPTTRFLVLTSHSSAEYGIDALKRGALSYHEKPGNPDLILSLIRDGISSTRLKRSSQSLDISNTLTCGSFELATSSPRMATAIESIKFAASNTQAVLLYGETGTGKGVFARAIHTLRYSRHAPFIRYQPNFANPDLVASELFGHVRGAFTGANENRRGLIEEANKGTLFIDEIDALPKEVQVLLLEVLQEKTYRKVGSNKLEKSSFRLIAALNRNPETLLADQVIRPDFYHRIAHFQITIPPLRERKEDIPLLTRHFIEQTAEKEELSVSRIEDPSLKILSEYSWPGNIRELQAVVEGACFRAAYRNDYAIQPSDIVLIRHGQSESLAYNSEGGSFRDQVRLFEEQLVLRALEEHTGNQAQAAKSLQMDRSVFRRILERTRY